MAELKLKKRGMTVPGKKGNVYFCCHPEDFSKTFEIISNDILAKQDCSIWYRDENDPYDESEHLENLAQMQLFVIPVTRNFLCTKNRALDLEFRFAVDKHIPVIPIMMEIGVSEIFNKKCENLQYLDKYDNDSTTISYDEKLEKYLSEVLVKDAVIKKIRDAFDAYVFLSYRKKDRKYAQELMRLIHKNEFCRNIAIWYDEFLTPGENFNDSIKEALEKSGLFVLAVTPNLVNEENYIMTTEYPMAKRENKPILPAELVPTDKELLCEKYEDIPECTDAHDSNALSEALLDSIKKIAIKEHASSPEHDFFIGLAYLGGIDVEVDYERAVSLITSAAETGLTEAIKKLVHMYSVGNGVQRDLEKAIEWQKKLVGVYKEAIDSCISITHGMVFNYLNAYIDVAAEYIDIDRYSDVYDVCMEIIAECDRLEKSTAGNDHAEYMRKRFKGTAYNKAADACIVLGDLEKASTYTKNAIEVFEAILTHNVIYDNFSIRSEYVRSLSNMGTIEREKNDLDTALSYFIKACNEQKEILNIQNKLTELNMPVRDNWAEVKYLKKVLQISDMYFIKHDLDKTKEYLKIVLSSLSEKDMKYGEIPCWVKGVIISAKLFFEMGKYNDVLIAANVAMTNIDSYEKKTGVRLFYNKLDISIVAGQAYFALNRIDECKKLLCEAEKINREYKEYCGLDVDKTLLSACYGILAGIALMEDKSDLSNDYFKISRKLIDECIAEGRTINLLHSVRIHVSGASIELYNGNLTSARELMLEAMELMEKVDIPESDIDYMKTDIMLSATAFNIMFVDGDWQGIVDMVPVFLKEFENYAKKVGDDCPEDIKSVRTNMHFNLAMSKVCIDKKEGISYIQNLCKIYESKSEEKKTFNDYDMLAVMYYTLSISYGILSPFKKAKSLKRALEMFEIMKRRFNEKLVFSISRKLLEK